MLLQSKPGDAERITDAQGHDVPNTPTTGPLFVYNRAVKNTHTNVSSHMNDLHDISKRPPEMIKPIVALLLDGGVMTGLRSQISITCTWDDFGEIKIWTCSSLLAAPQL